MRCLRTALLMLLLVSMPWISHAGVAADALPRSVFESAERPLRPVDNAAFAPSADASVGTALSGVLEISQATLVTEPVLTSPPIRGREPRLFPSIRLTLYSIGDRLVPVERGTLVAEFGTHTPASYWSVIPETGRIWHEAADGDWDRAALPITLVNDTENAAHQGLLTFLYRGAQTTAVRLQLVQQSGPYLVQPQFVAAALASTRFRRAARPEDDAQRAQAEWASRLPTRPLQALAATVPTGTLDGLGGPLLPQWRVAVALVVQGTLWQAQVQTPFGPYPYPEGMRFGVRSVMKSVAAPLALLHLAQEYGPWVLELPIGRYVEGLDSKYQQVRFIDAADMASGFGGQGTLQTDPNNMYDGYLGGDYDAWYLAPSHAEKVAEIRRTLSPYPWNPGTVVRYRDQDFYLLGAAIDGFLKSVRGPDADLWELLKANVFAPIGIAHAPAVRTQEAAGVGHVWANAGYYPTLDDLAKIALLYQQRGAWGGRQLLHRGLVDDLLAAKGALEKNSDAVRPAGVAGPVPRYRMGFHFLPYTSPQTGQGYEVPSMQGSGENEVILAPNGVISLRMAKASSLPEGTPIVDEDGDATLRVLDRLQGFAR